MGSRPHSCPRSQLPRAGALPGCWAKEGCPPFTPTQVAVWPRPWAQSWTESDFLPCDLHEPQSPFLRDRGGDERQPPGGLKGILPIKPSPGPGPSKSCYGQGGTRRPGARGPWNERRAREEKRLAHGCAALMADGPAAAPTGARPRWELFPFPGSGAL